MDRNQRSRSPEYAIVLIGTYRLLDIRDQSGQLVRRSEIIHFPRYDSNDKSDLMQFRKVLESFLNHMPLATHPQLGDCVEDFYIRSGGCVGILKELLSRAYADHSDVNKPLALDFVLKRALGNKALKTIIEEALAGEEKLAEIPDEVLQNLLKSGLPKISEPKPVSAKPSVGTRKATRDESGGAYATA